MWITALRPRHEGVPAPVAGVPSSKLLAHELLETRIAPQWVPLRFDAQGSRRRSHGQAAELFQLRYRQILLACLRVDHSQISGDDRPIVGIERTRQHRDGLFS